MRRKISNNLDPWCSLINYELTKGGSFVHDPPDIDAERLNKLGKTIRIVVNYIASMQSKSPRKDSFCTRIKVWHLQALLES